MGNNTKIFLKRLFNYNRDSNRALITLIQDNAAKVPGNSLKLVSHILNAHRIWNCRIEKKTGPSGSWTIQPTDSLNTLDEENHETSLRIIDQYRLEDIIEYTTFRGDLLCNQVQDIVFHTINHATYHRGQIATDLRLAGLEPVATDYIFYKPNNQ